MVLQGHAHTVYVVSHNGRTTVLSIVISLWAMGPFSSTAV